MYKYSNTKIKSLFKIPEFRFIFQKVTSNFYDEIIDISKPHIAKNLELYREAVNELLKL